MAQRPVAEVIKEIIAELKSTTEELKSIHGFMDGVRVVLNLVPQVIKKVEHFSGELNIKGADKKELALEVLMSFVPAKLPWWAPRWVIRRVLATAVEEAVERFFPKGMEKVPGI